MHGEVVCVGLGYPRGNDSSFPWPVPPGGGVAMLPDPGLLTDYRDGGAYPRLLEQLIVEGS